MITMDRTSSSMILMNIPSGSSGSRSVSPMTPSPSRELRGARLFRAISRRLGRRSRNDIEEDSRSSSTDSCSSSSAGCGRPSRKCQEVANSISSESSGFRSVSPHRISSSSNSSDAGSDTQTVRSREHHRSISGAAFRKVFKSLSINSRSQSCCDSKRKASKKTTPKRILRPPVTYTYVRGLSGLPTQRIPNPKVYVTQTGCGGCSVQYMAALHR